MSSMKLKDSTDDSYNVEVNNIIRTTASPFKITNINETTIEKTEPFILMSLTPVSLQSFTSDSLIGKNLCVQFIRHLKKKNLFKQSKQN